MAGVAATPLSVLEATPYNFNPSTDDPQADWTLTVTATTYIASVYDKNLGTSSATAKTVPIRTSGAMRAGTPPPGS